MSIPPFGPIWLVGIGATLLGIAEIWAIVTPAQGDTISELTWRLADWQGGLMALTWGVLGGHFFGWRWKLIAAMAVGIAAGTLFYNRKDPDSGIPGDGKHDK